MIVVEAPRLGAASHSRSGADQVDRIDHYATRYVSERDRMRCSGPARAKAANDRAEQLGGTPRAIKAQVLRDLAALERDKRSRS